MNELKYKVGDRVKYDSEICTVTKVLESQGKFKYRVQSDTWFDVVEDEMIEGLVEEKTPKFKVNDIVSVKNIGWVRITNSYWDSLANEYIYEAIGFNGEGEYDCISQSNIEGQMLPESENPHTGGNKITLDEYKNNDKEWLFNKLAMLDNITALESIQDIFNHLQQSNYPKTYAGCCDKLYRNSRHDECYEACLQGHPMQTFARLLICRDAYWKIAGEEMGLGKPWKPDYDSGVDKFGIICLDRVVQESNPTTNWERHLNKVLDFPTREMRDAFYENFKDLIESCKEFL